MSRTAGGLLLALPALAGALLVFQTVGSTGMLPLTLSLALVGFLLFGPDALISGAAAQDIGGERGARGSEWSGGLQGTAQRLLLPVCSIRNNGGLLAWRT